MLLNGPLGVTYIRAVKNVYNPFIEALYANLCSILTTCTGLD